MLQQFTEPFLREMCQIINQSCLTAVLETLGYTEFSLTSRSALIRGLGHHQRTTLLSRPELKAHLKRDHSLFASSGRPITALHCLEKGTALQRVPFQKMLTRG